MEKIGSEVVSKIQRIKNKMDEMLDVDSQNELIDIYTEIVGELGTCYAALMSAIMSNEKVSQSNAESKESDDAEMVETESADIIEDNEQDTPAYAVFYSLNNAAYVAINERMNICVPVRNIAKAYCVPADIDSIANAKNTLSAYKLEKLKPLEIKFLTQREYDDTIGKALAMKELMKDMSKVQSSNQNVNHKVTNFASNTKSTSSLKSIVSDNKSHTEKKYDWFNSKPYNTGTKKHTMAHKPFSKRYSLTDTIENPRALYGVMHDGIDGYNNDTVYISNQVFDDIDDFDVLIPLINDTIYKISDTNSGWLTDTFTYQNRQIDNDYMMEIDYALLDTAIDEWNSEHKPAKIMYVENFDPTICNFKKNIKDASKKYGIPTGELAAMAIYNYTRCILAYDEFMCRNGYLASNLS